MDTLTQPHTYTDCVRIEEDANHDSNNFRDQCGKIIFYSTWHRSTRLCVDQKNVRRANLAQMIPELEPCLIGMEACSVAHYWA